MSKPVTYSNPTILTAIRIWWKEATRPELKLRKRSQEIPDYLECIVPAMIFAVLTFNFIPKPLVEADILKDSRNVWNVEEVELAPRLDTDLQKTTDSWKNNPKPVYIAKSLTVQNAIWQYLTVNMGLPDIQAAGIFGNMMVESGSRTFNVRPEIYSPGNAYYGLCQWNTGGHHSSINGGALDEQLEYLNDTIENEMGSSNYQRFLNATTPEEASVIFGQWYERCGAPTSRQNEARRAYERFAV